MSLVLAWFSVLHPFISKLSSSSSCPSCWSALSVLPSHPWQVSGDGGGRSSFPGSHRCWGIAGRWHKGRLLQLSPLDSPLLRAAARPDCRHQPDFSLLWVCCHLYQVGLYLEGWTWAGGAAWFWSSRIDPPAVAVGQHCPILTSASSSKKCSCPLSPCEGLCWQGVRALDVGLFCWSCLCSEQDCLGVKAKTWTFPFSFFWEYFGLASLPVKTSEGHVDKRERGWFKENRLLIIWDREFCFPFFSSSFVHFCPLFINLDKQLICELTS